MFNIGKFPRLDTMTVPLCEDSMGVAKDQMLLTLYNHIKDIADKHNELPRWRWWARRDYATEIAALINAGNVLANWSYRDEGR